MKRIKLTPELLKYAERINAIESLVKELVLTGELKNEKKKIL